MAGAVAWVGKPVVAALDMPAAAEAVVVVSRVMAREIHPRVGMASWILSARNLGWLDVANDGCLSADPGPMVRVAGHRK